MNTNGWIATIVVVLIIIAGGYYLYMSNNGVVDETGGTTASSTDQSISDGTITMPYSLSDWGLAVSPEQILAQSYIPPCDSPFNYCFYYNGGAYQGTNFDSAGLRVTKRADLTTERTCLETPPTGFDASTTPTASSSTDLYSTSKFGNVGQGAAGHTSSDTLYRLFYRSPATCYEFDARVAQSQFANYPAGSIQEFTTAKQNEVQSKLMSLLSNFTIGTQKLQLP